MKTSQVFFTLFNVFNLYLEKTLAKEAEIEQIRKELATRHHLVNERRSSFEQKAQRQQEVMKVQLPLSIYL